MSGWKEIEGDLATWINVALLLWWKLEMLLNVRLMARISENGLKSVVAASLLLFFDCFCCWSVVLLQVGVWFRLAYGVIVTCSILLFGCATLLGVLWFILGISLFVGGWAEISSIAKAEVFVKKIIWIITLNPFAYLIVWFMLVLFLLQGSFFSRRKPREFILGCLTLIAWLYIWIVKSEY